MVQAIMEGRKTMTRRVFKITPYGGKPTAITSKEESLIELADNELNDYGTINYLSTGGLSGPYKCPYGKPGDVLWVRETWTIDDRGANGDDPGYYYKADIPTDAWKGFWKPSIFMPKEACRIFLEVVSVRVERLQDISEQDAIAEGIQFHFEELFQENRYRDYDPKLQREYGDPNHDYPTWREAVSSFKSLWQSINGRESWDANPWIWVIEFKRIKKPEDFK